MDYIFNGVTCEVSIIKLGDINSSGKIGASGEVSSIDFELDDTSSLLKAKVNTEILEGTICVLWHHYYDLPSSDASILLYGKLAGPIKWSEEARTFSANIESIQGKGEIGFTPSEDVNSEDYISGLLPSAYNTPWPIIFGSPKRVPIVQIRGTEGGEYTYVVGLYDNIGIERVLAQRTCIGDKSDDLYLVPAGMYSVGTESLGGHTVTTITFPALLSTIENAKWTDEIFVDVSSSLSSNPITQIQWILDNFTDLNIDAASFATAAGLMGDTPAHYALFSQQDALPLCEKIAWQARCLLFIKNGTAYIRPLFVNTVTDATITLNEAKLKSMELSFTLTEDIITVFNAKWVQDYGGQKEASQITTTKNNLLRYGVISQDYDFFIYTTLRAIQVASSFWAYRYANSWRRATVKTFLPSLNIEAFDCIQFSHPTLSTYAIRGFAESVKHDLENNSIAIEAELGSKAGDHSGGQPTEDPYYWSGAVGSRNGYTTPIAARQYKTICVYDDDTDGDGVEDDEGARGHTIHIESGSLSANQAYEIYRVEKDHQRMGVGNIDLYHVGTPREDNIEPGQILFSKTATVGYYGYGFPAGEDVWCEYDLNPQNHPNYFDSPTTQIGNNVGIEIGYQRLSKARSGFVVTGIEGNKVCVSAGSVDPKLEKIRSADAIGAYNPAEIYGYDGDRTLVRVPTADSIPPGRIIHPITDLPAGSNGKGYNAFDVSPYVTGDTPSEIGAEFGTAAGSQQLVEGNTGYVSLGRKGGRNQYRPF